MESHLAALKDRPPRLRAPQRPRNKQLLDSELRKISLRRVPTVLGRSRLGAGSKARKQKRLAGAAARTNSSSQAWWRIKMPTSSVIQPAMEATGPRKGPMSFKARLLVMKDALNGMKGKSLLATGGSASTAKRAAKKPCAAVTAKRLKSPAARRMAAARFRPCAAQRKACGRNLLETRWAQWLGARNQRMEQALKTAKTSSRKRFRKPNAWTAAG
mmetsp:Transcript_74957/g.165547  ORF Transcript_74957/g.165547 Transcript_74957/m.165547 type:complete len:215 (+) Transcript_74957:501-1145(+)